MGSKNPFDLDIISVSGSEEANEGENTKGMTPQKREAILKQEAVIPQQSQFARRRGNMDTLTPKKTEMN